MVGRARQYELIAPVYDLVSGEWPVYRAGRLAGVSGLRLSRGDRVLVVGCGTGLDLRPVHDRVGDDGRFVGLDASRAMLARAGRRAASLGWSGVELVAGDATRPPAQRLAEALGDDGADAVLFTYALSLMDDWPAAWRAAVALARPGARVAVVDMQRAQRGPRPLRALADVAMWSGGADPAARPWQAVEQQCTDVDRADLRGGHVQVRAGTLPT
ncbi:methyltransferase domain-containing protein [Modestobacter sp. VKM Ac-2979]|uniref:class I SAM-dependent methyltransferase n=1 Tax=unclassified Modestobacter TaxID=2643866 RepID=UPI0022AB8B1D|nr:MULTISPECIES: methyltransferase domain-containing protein [unclassified Modestobacter]MCZ2813462.1 methyltransferase domain-containing protein [Modestobacter sp. VKM Ac-2979]MCZ2842346.1 methyltransferase domain-containing protein [Modestobacter sp. VKM Ac-2980]